MRNFLRTLLVAAPLVAGGLAAGSGNAAEAATVNCGSNGNSIQKAVDNANGPTTINIVGVCAEDVTIAKDGITLSGNHAGLACDRNAPGGTGTIEGTVTVDGVRATIAFLTITGPGPGIDIANRANVELICNDISGNAAYGVNVGFSSNAVLRGNTLSGNGTRAEVPWIFWDCGLNAAAGSTVDSRGNTYADNQFCAVSVATQSVFRNGVFMPNEPGHPASPEDRDAIVELGCNPSTGEGCHTNDEGPVAIDIYNGGLADFRNADISGEIGTSAQSSFRVDGDAAVQGNILASYGSIVRFRNRSFYGDREVTYTGTLTCDATSLTFGGNVQCGQTCSGSIPGNCGP